MSDGPDDEIPIVATYRGVGLHDQQSAARLRVVKREIDRVHKMANPERLVPYLKDAAHPPEARLFALAKVEALVAMARDARRPPPRVDIDHVRACTAGLDSRRWRSRSHYCALFDLPTRPECSAVKRETPLADD
jgi:hypothetical protein